MSEPIHAELLEKLHEAVLVLSTDGIILYCNQAAGVLYGMDPNELIGLAFANPIDEASITTIEIPSHQENNIIADMHAEKISWQNLSAWLVTLHDVTDLVESKKQLGILANVFKYAKEGVIITDENHDIIDVNSEFERITGYKKSEVLGKNPRILHSGKQNPFFYKKMWRDIGAYGFWFGELWNRRRDGHTYPQMLAISTVKDENDDVSNYVAVFYDISEFEAQKSLIRKMSQYDLLTDLPNQAVFIDRLKQTIKHIDANHLCCIILFSMQASSCNSTDSTINTPSVKVCAQKIKALIPDNCTLSRLENDYFCILYPNCKNSKQAINLTETIIADFAQPLRAKDQCNIINLKAGLTLTDPGESISAQEMLSQANQALYQARISPQRDWVIFDTAIDKKQREHELLRADILTAIEQNQFELYLQPKLFLIDNTITGCEALIRWNHPILGLLTPDQFIPSINDTDLFVALSDHIATIALDLLSDNNKYPDYLSLSINLDPCEIIQANFTKRVDNWLKSYPPSVKQRLELEVLESHEISDISALNAVLKHCHQQGIKFAIDDFGTGYSAFTYLIQVNFDYLKIDKSIITPITTDPVSRTILQAIITMAKACDFTLIAEGAESKLHLEILTAFGCDIAQGYALAKPMPVSQFSKWLKNFKKKNQ